MKFVARGGNREHAPPNSLVALISAYTGGADAVLLTVRRTLDNVLVVAEANALQHPTGTAGLVSEKTLKELKALDFSAGW